MKSIGYIISKHKYKDIMNGIEVINDKTAVPIGFPYLIVGLENAKKNIENFNISNKQVDNLCYWTFGKTERRNEFEKDLNAFYEVSINNIINNIKYYYINILSIKYNKFKNMYNIINSEERKYIYISNNMIYIYVNKYILGISITMLKYSKINISKIISKLKKNPNNIVYTNDSFLPFKIKSSIKDKKYLTSYFMSLQT